MAYCVHKHVSPVDKDVFLFGHIYENEGGLNNSLRLFAQLSGIANDDGFRVQSL